MHTQLLAVSILIIAAVGTSAAPAVEPSAVISPSKDTGWSCQDVPKHGTVCVPSGEIAAKAAGGRKCIWKCTIERGVEVCRGSGPECNGKIPPQWK